MLAQAAQLFRQPLGLSPFGHPFGIGNEQANKVRALVTIDHRLQNLWLERQHAFDALRRHIVALVVDDQILFAVGDDDAALRIDMPDVAGVEPTIDQHPRGFGVIAPIALHHQLAAHQNLAVVGNLDLGVHQRRTDGVHLDARCGAVAADHRPRLGLAIALQQRQPDRVKEHPDFGIKWRAP